LAQGCLGTQASAAVVIETLGDMRYPSMPRCFCPPWSSPAFRAQGLPRTGRVVVPAVQFPCRKSSGIAPSLALAQDSLQINWGDGVVSHLHPNWLRERCQSDATVDPETKQPKKTPHELPEDIFLKEALLLTNLQDLQVSFSDGHVSQFMLHRLRMELNSFGETPIQVPQYNKLRPRLWSGKTAKLPRFTHEEVVQDERVRLMLIEELLTGGQALVRGVPREEGEVVRFGEMLSTLRSTDWGPCFNVRTKPDDAKVAGQGEKKDLAYTPKPIGFHTDNPYRFPIPDFQLLHAIEHCFCPDGHAPCQSCQVMNYTVDGFYIAELLRQEDPEAFRLLCEVPVRFENNGGDNGSALVHVAPHLELEDGLSADGSQVLKAVRFSAKSGQYAPPLHPKQLTDFYRARRRFSELAHDERHVMSMQFKPGDLLIFDNQRLLHARSGIAPTDGERWVQGCYVNRDGLWLNYERWRRRA